MAGRRGCVVRSGDEASVDWGCRGRGIATVKALSRRQFLRNGSVVALATPAALTVGRSPAEAATAPRWMRAALHDCRVCQLHPGDPRRRGVDDGHDRGVRVRERRRRSAAGGNRRARGLRHRPASCRHLHRARVFQRRGSDHPPGARAIRGQGSKQGANPSFAGTIISCSDASAGLVASGTARYEGFMSLSAGCPTDVSRVTAVAQPG